MKKKMIIRLFLFFIFFNLTFANAQEKKNEILVFAPASLRDAISEIVDTYQKEKKNTKIIKVFLGTSQLAKQVYNGANPDIFISANKEWMDFLEENSLILKNSRLNYLTNSLVLISNKNNFMKSQNSVADVKNTLLKTKTRISLALVNAVPAGIYSKQFLQKLKIWNAVKNNIAQSTNVRAAMKFVANGDLEYGMVYKTDFIAAKNNIKIIYEINPELHDEIIYPMAAMNNNESTFSFYKYLLNKNSKLIMTKWGFKIYNYDKFY